MFGNLCLRIEHLFGTVLFRRRTRVPGTHVRRTSVRRQVFPQLFLRSTGHKSVALAKNLQLSTTNSAALFRECHTPSGESESWQQQCDPPQPTSTRQHTSSHHARKRDQARNHDQVRNHDHSRNHYFRSREHLRNHGSPQQRFLHRLIRTGLGRLVSAATAQASISVARLAR